MIFQSDCGIPIFVCSDIGSHWETVPLTVWKVYSTSSGERLPKELQYGLSVPCSMNLEPPQHQHFSHPATRGANRHNAMNAGSHVRKIRAEALSAQARARPHSFQGDGINGIKHSDGVVAE